MINQARAHSGASGPATQADVTAMQAALKQDFELADANWRSFTP